MANQQGLVVRDNAGTYYVISGETIEAGRVPENKKAELEQALKGEDVSGFLFFDTIFQNAVTNVGQQNNASANNVAVGFFTGPQTIAQVQGNAANVGTSQTAHT